MESTTESQRIQLARKQAGLTQQGFADLVGVHRVQVAKWETGKSTPYPSTLQKIAEATNKPVAWFTADDSLTLDLKAKLSPEALDKLTDIAADADRSVPDQAAVTLMDALATN